MARMNAYRVVVAEEGGGGGHKGAGGSENFNTVKIEIVAISLNEKRIMRKRCVPETHARPRFIDPSNDGFLRTATTEQSNFLDGGDSLHRALSSFPRFWLARREIYLGRNLY